jgi:hypothetical protein
VSSYGTVTLSSQTAEGQGTAAIPADLHVQGSLDTTAGADVLDLQLFEQYGAFAVAGGIRPGTYRLTGGELNYDSCGLCVSLLSHFDVVGQPQIYWATGGTVEITEVAPRFVARLTDLTFTHVTITASNHSTIVGDGCTSAILAASFTVDTNLR